MGLFHLIVSSVLFGLATLFIYLYYVKKGQFDDCEDVKYQVFFNDEYPVSDKGEKDA